MVNRILICSVSTIPQRESQAPGGEDPDARCPGVLLLRVSVVGPESLSDGAAIAVDIPDVHGGGRPDVCPPSVQRRG